jgi:hypothetical protein
MPGLAHADFADPVADEADVLLPFFLNPDVMPPPPDDRNSFSRAPEKATAPDGIFHVMKFSP